MGRLLACSLSAALVATAGLVAMPALAPAPAVCASLARLGLPDTTIKAADEITGSSFAPPGGSTALRKSARVLPHGCRDETVTFEV